MLILLPPSETKSGGGRGEPLDFDALSFPSLTPIRRSIADEVINLSYTPAAFAALGLTAAREDELERNRALLTSPTTSAITRYTGVLYDALDVVHFTQAQKSKALARIVIGSAMFGAVRAGDAIPAYRLSANSTLPGFGSLGGHWKPALSDALSALECGLIIDLRSGGYQNLGKVAGAVTVDVVTERADGSRAVVSHFNKHHKGLLARALVVTRAEPHNVAGVAKIARAAGLRAELTGPSAMVIVTNA